MSESLLGKDFFQ